MSENLGMTLIREKDEDLEHSSYLSLIRDTYNPYQDTGSQSYLEKGVFPPLSEQTEEISKLKSEDLSPVYDDTAQPSREIAPNNMGRSLPTPPPQVSKPTLGVQFPSLTSFKKKNMKKQYETQAPRQASVRPLRFYDKTSSCGCSSSSNCCCCRPRNCILVILILLLAAGCFAGCYYVFVYVIKPSNTKTEAELKSLLYGEIEYLEQNSTFLASNRCNSEFVRRINKAFEDTILSEFLKNTTIIGQRYSENTIGSVCRFIISLDLDETKLHGIEKFAAIILEELIISKFEKKTKLLCIVMALKTNAASNRCPETSINATSSTLTRSAVTSTVTRSAVTSSTMTRSAVTSSTMTQSVKTTSPAESSTATSRTAVSFSETKSSGVTSSAVKSRVNTTSV